ncbi:MAG: NPCBM/NEW2 domain-containing protein [Sedimentisphaerales bacterium]|nr:NPCBM/NEW2 domain-containing protein [Sedimentisphaerales bacterium]
MSSEIQDENVKILVSELLDGELSDDQQKQLLCILKSDDKLSQRVLELFIDSCVFETYLSLKNPRIFIKKVVLNSGYLDTGKAFTNRVATEALRQDISTCSANADTKQLEAIKQYARDQLQAFLEEQKEIQRLLARKKQPFFLFDIDLITKKTLSFIRFTKKAAIAAVISLCILSTVFLSFHYYMSNRIVATLGQTFNAKWEQKIENTELHIGKMKLLEGYAAVKFKKGAEVIIQAPSSFNLKSSNKMFMETGWVTAKVPPAAKGFEIQTSSSSVIDYGTEFGLMVGNENLSELHVFDGKISLTSNDNSNSSKKQQLWLEHGQAATIDANGHIDRENVADRPRLFIRNMPTSEGIIVPGKTLSLADMIGGGNGLGTGILNQGIDPATGQVTILRKNSTSGRGFIPQTDMIFIDGVFVPDSSNGPCIVTTTGIEFSDCPKTNGKSYEIIANAAMFCIEGFNEYHDGRLNGRIYNTAYNPSISIHANSGITFDLDEIRSFMPDVEVVRFRALCGVSETLSEYLGAETAPKIVDMDFWVLIDGKTRFTKRLTAELSQAAQIDIQINQHDRFLTLATTNPSNISMRWGMFAEPILELKKTETKR